MSASTVTGQLTAAVVSPRALTTPGSVGTFMSRAYQYQARVRGLLGVEDAIVVDAVDRRRHAGDHRRVGRVGHRRRDADDPSAEAPVLRQPTKGRHLRRAAVEVRGRLEPVDGDDHDVRRVRLLGLQARTREQSGCHRDDEEDSCEVSDGHVRHGRHRAIRRRRPTAAAGTCGISRRPPRPAGCSD